MSCSLRGESPQSSSRRASAHLLLCMHTSVGRNRSASNAHSQQSHTSHKAGINCKHTHTQPTLSAAFPARQAMSAASRQILTAYSRRRSPAVYWRTAHGGRSARILSAVALVVLVSSDRGRPHEPRGFGSRELCGRLIERRWWRRGKRAQCNSHNNLHCSGWVPPRQSELSYSCLFKSVQADRELKVLIIAEAPHPYPRSTASWQRGGGK